MATECLVCVDRFPVEAMVRLACSHYHCKRCLTAAFKISIESNPFFPLRCCYQIPTVVVRNLILWGDAAGFDASSLQKYREKLAEHEVMPEQRLYCWKKHCRAFIPLLLRDKRGGTCRNCKSRTCSTCTGMAHCGPCPAARSASRPRTDDEARLLALARSWGWKRCPQCRNMVEKNTGCNHIRCRCGCDFCYRCGRAPYSDHGRCAM